LGNKRCALDPTLGPAATPPIITIFINIPFVINKDELFSVEIGVSFLYFFLGRIWGRWLKQVRTCLANRPPVTLHVKLIEGVYRTFPDWMIEKYGHPDIIYEA
jgi:hypothetical protein